MAKKDKKAEVLGQIRNPLVFFALALLLIEGIIGLVVTKANMRELYTFYCICIMAVLFLVVVCVVTLITIKWPRHLYEDIVHEIETTHAIKEYIESLAFKDTIEDILYQRIKAECIKETNFPQEENGDE
ncbi:MAG: hypothetical protein AB1567_10720 [bacterium]